MKKLIFLALFAIPMFCKAQTDTSANQKKNSYCIVETNWNSVRFYATLDDGTKTKAKDMEIKDSNGKQLPFTSKIALLDYITQRGWTLVSSYCVGASVLGFVFEKTVATNLH